MMQPDTLLPKLVRGRRANSCPDADWFHFLEEEFQNAETIEEAAPVFLGLIGS
jgi:hypothetical protein